MLTSGVTNAQREVVLDVAVEHRPFRDMVRDFLNTHLPQSLRAAARATPTVFAEPEIGREWQRILYDKGWLAYNWPREFGGTGWSPIERYIFEKECALADVPGLPVLGLKLLAPVLYTFGTPRQQQRYLPKILSGEHYWCQGFSEVGAGSDLASLKTRAEKDGTYYRVNGSKIWTTHAQFADHMFCLVRTDSQVKAQRGISFLLVDMKQAGVRVRPITTLAGDHEVNEVFLDDVRVHEDDLVGTEGQGWSIAKFLLENERGGSCYAPKLLVDIARLRSTALHEPSGQGTAVHDDPLFAAELARLELEAQALEMTELRILEQVGHDRRPGPADLHCQAGGLRAAASRRCPQPEGFRLRRLAVGNPSAALRAPQPGTGVLEGSPGGRAALSQQPGVVDLRRYQRDPTQHHRQNRTADLKESSNATGSR